MKRILLTQNQYALVDDEWYEYLHLWKWFAHWRKGTQSYYAQRKDGKSIIHMHRVVMSTLDNMKCDHKNHDTLNNQTYNLRNLTHSQNLMNRGASITNKLQEKCIYFRKGRYVVQIRAKGRKGFYKRFDTLEDAKHIRDMVIKEFHGEYAYV